MSIFSSSFSSLASQLFSLRSDSVITNTVSESSSQYNGAVDDVCFHSNKLSITAGDWDVWSGSVAWNNCSVQSTCGLAVVMGWSEEMRISIV